MDLPAEGALHAVGAIARGGKTIFAEGFSLGFDHGERPSGLRAG